MAIEPLSLSQLVLASLVLITMAALTIVLRIGVARPLLIAALRMALQLSLVGIVLQWMFNHASPMIIAITAFIMLAAAGREVVARQNRRLGSIWLSFGVGASAMFISSFAVSLLALGVIIRPDPWYQAQYAIPFLGMLLGNTMNSISLCLDRLMDSVWSQKNIIEQRLMLGESPQEAVADLLKASLRSGMMPIINAMAAAGLVSLPGMMTGQILAGNSPTIAVNYQIFILFLIAAGAGFGMIIASRISSNLLFDKRARLRLDRLSKPRF